MIKSPESLRDQFELEDLTTSEGVDRLYYTIEAELNHYWSRYRNSVAEIVKSARSVSTLGANHALNGSQTRKAALLQADELGLINTQGSRIAGIWGCDLPRRENI